MTLSPALSIRSPVLGRPLSRSVEEELEAINAEVEGMLVVVEKGLYNAVSSLDNDSIDIALIECTPRFNETKSTLNTPQQRQYDESNQPNPPHIPSAQQGDGPLLPLQPMNIELNIDSIHVIQTPSYSDESMCTNKQIESEMQAGEEAQSYLDGQPTACMNMDNVLSNVANGPRGDKQPSQKDAKSLTAIIDSKSTHFNNPIYNKPSKEVYFTNIDKNECLPVKVLTKDPSSSQQIIKVYGLERRYFCRVCHDPFVKPMTTKCGHTFCAACIYSCTLYWKQHTCPICMKHLPSVPYLDDVIDAVVTARLEYDLSFSLKIGDLVQVLTTGSHVYAFEIGFLSNIQEGYISESRQQVVLPSEAQSKVLNPGPRFTPSIIATVDVGGRLWFGRLADLLPFNADLYPLGTRPTRGSIIIDSRKLNLKLFDKQDIKNKIEHYPLNHILEKVKYVKRDTDCATPTMVSQENHPSAGENDMHALWYELYDCGLRITDDQLARNPLAYADNCITKISMNSQKIYLDNFRELQQLKVVVTDLAEEARKNMDFDETDYICSLFQPKFFSQSEFPDYFERPDSSLNYRLFISENAAARSIELQGSTGPEYVTNLCPYLSVVTNLTLWNKFRDFCCVGCKQLLRLPVKLKCGHFYCYNCALDSIKMCWPCLGCGTCLSLPDFNLEISHPDTSQRAGSNSVDSLICPFVDTSRFVLLNKALSDAMKSLFPLHKVLLDKWQPVRISLAIPTVGIIYDDPSYDNVRVLMDSDTVATVSIADLIPLDLLAFRPALRGSFGMLLLNTLFQNNTSAYTGLKLSDGKTCIDNLEPPCDFFETYSTNLFVCALVKIHNKTRATALVRNGSLLIALQNMTHPFISTGLRFVPDFSKIIAFFNYILSYIRETKAKEEKDLITKQYHDRYMEENNIGFVKDDLHAQKRQIPETICPNAWKDASRKVPSIEHFTGNDKDANKRAASIAPRSNTKKPQQAFERQRYQAQVNKVAKQTGPPKPLNNPFTSPLAEYRDTLLENATVKSKLAELKREEQRLIKLMKSDPQMESNISSFASILKVLLKTKARDFLCSACNLVVRHPCRLHCGHLVCRSCAVTYYTGRLGCLVCGTTIPSVHDLFLDISSFQQTTAYVPRNLQSEQIDKGMFVIRPNSRKCGMGIVLNTIQHIGTDYASVRFVEGTITVRISELQVVLPKQQLSIAPAPNSSLPCLFALQVTLKDPLIGSACIYWPPEDLEPTIDSSSSLRRGLFGLICDYNSQIITIMFETGTEARIPPNHILSLQMVGPMPKFELQRRWSQAELKVKEEDEKYERNRAIEMQIIVSLERDDVRDLELAGSVRRLRPGMKIQSCRPTDLGDYNPPAIFFSEAAYREQIMLAQRRRGLEK